jgi:hypothetical protein
MHSFVKRSALFLVLVAGLSACASAATPERSAADIVLTEGVHTMVAAHFMTQTALIPPVSATFPKTFTPTPTFTALGTALASPSATPTWLFYTATLGTPLTPTVTGTFSTATIDPSSLAFGCNNLAFVTDVTIPNGTVLKPKQDFGKTWKVANTGTCNWLSHYALDLVGGPAMGAKTSNNLGRIVTAGHWAELTLGMGAPKEPGTYTSYWRLRTADGHAFGTTLVLSVVVSSPTNTPQPPTNTPEPTATPSPTPTPSPTTAP